MKRLRTLGKPLAAALMVCAALDASSLTLGRVRGAALLGQPLNVSVAVQPGTNEDASSICLDARVFYGDTQQAPNQITVSAEPGPNQSFLAQIYAHTNISEPVVTVELLAGCGQKTSRKYVLFADIASDAGSQAAPTRSRSALTSEVVMGDVALPKTSAWDAPVKPIAAASPRSGGITALPLPKALRTKPVVPKAPRATGSDSKLQLAAPLAGPDRQPELKSSPQLPAAPIEDLQKRVDAIAQWKALTLTPEEVQKNDARVQSLESDLKALQAVTVKNQQNVQLLSNALENAESERYANPLVYALLALLAGILAVAAYVVSKSKSPNANAVPWWGNGEVQSAAVLPDKASLPKPVLPVKQPAQVARRESTQKPEPAVSTPLAGGSQNVVNVDIALGDSAFSALDFSEPTQAAKKAVPEVRRADRRDFSPSGSATLRAINTKEMLDVRQQAEFFMALGQHDEAIKVLVSSINESAEANPLVYLDLLKLYHTLSRRAEFDRYRDEFNLQFTGLVPSYASFLMEGNGLETYADICSQIVALWPSDDALEYIEMCLVRQPQDEPGQGFDLDAFRDLLTLHGVLRRLDSELDSAMVPFSASRMGGSSQIGGLLGEASTAYDEQLDIATAPLPPIPHTNEAGEGSLDLDLTTPPSNLMDFDVQGLGSTPKPGGPQA